jgi:hypothetical protein
MNTNRFEWSYTAPPELVAEMKRAKAERDAEIERVAKGTGQAMANIIEQRCIAALLAAGVK